jgi:hydroxymethylpyrimidine/phosphomethylpyrimidine kinase
MSLRPYVLTIAGFDPSGGAGILADIKTFEAHQTLGLGVCSALTYQTEKTFEGVTWVEEETIIKQLDPLLKAYTINYVKIGLIENIQVLNSIINYLSSKNPSVRIIWDPILSASAGFSFHSSISKKELTDLAEKIYLITPNLKEIKQLFPDLPEEEAAFNLSKSCAVFLKGGHGNDNTSNDVLFSDGKRFVFESVRLTNDKHGTGCVLSACIAAALTKGLLLEEACGKAKEYTGNFILSNNTLLGYHYA